MRITRSLSAITAVAAVFAVAACGGTGGGTGSSDTVTVYSADGLGDWYKAEFEDFTKATGIKVALVEAGSGEVVSRAQKEKANPQVDVLVTLPPFIQQAQQQGSLAKSGIDTSAVPAPLKSADGTYVAVVNNYFAMIRNTAAQPKPADWAEFTGPAYQQKIQYSTPGKAGDGTALLLLLQQIMGKEGALDYLRDLQPNNVGPSTSTGKLGQEVVEIVADADDHAAGLDGAARGVGAAAVETEVGGAETDLGAVLRVEPGGEARDGHPRIHPQVREQRGAADDVLRATAGELGPDLVGGAQGDLAGPCRGEFLEDGEFGGVTGDREAAGGAGAESGTAVQIEPALAGQVGQLGEVPGLSGDAGVPEIADGGTDGPGVALDDGDRQAAGERLDGMGQAHDAGADDEDVRSGVHGTERGGSSYALARPSAGCLYKLFVCTSR